MIKAWALILWSSLSVLRQPAPLMSPPTETSPLSHSILCLPSSQEMWSPREIERSRWVTYDNHHVALPDWVSQMCDEGTQFNTRKRHLAKYNYIATLTPTLRPTLLPVPCGCFRKCSMYIQTLDLEWAQWLSELNHSGIAGIQYWRLASLWSSLLLIHPGAGGAGDDGSSPYHPCGRSRWNSWFLALTWLSSGCCENLENKLANEILSLSLFFLFPQPCFLSKWKINKH